MTVLFRLFVMSILIALASGCASSAKTPARMKTEKAYYQEAQKNMTAGNFSKAVSSLEQLESHYPVGTYTEQAQLELIYARFRHVDYAGASAAADRFIRLHPNHPQADYAYYMKGLSDYEADRDFFTRYLPVEAAWRDLNTMRDAFNNFRDLVTRFPESEFAPDARARMVFIRNQLAESELHVARFYARKKAYVSAVSRARWVAENYSGSPQVADAIALQIWAYEKLGMKELSEQQLALLKTNFPQYARLDRVTQMVAGNEDRSWLNILTFGLLGDAGYAAK